MNRVKSMLRFVIFMISIIANTAFSVITRNGIMDKLVERRANLRIKRSMVFGIYKVLSNKSLEHIEEEKKKFLVEYTNSNQEIILSMLEQNGEVPIIEW